jgi:hypothetical protein
VGGEIPSDELMRKLVLEENLLGRFGGGYLGFVPPPIFGKILINRDLLKTSSNIGASLVEDFDLAGT